MPLKYSENLKHFKTFLKTRIYANKATKLQRKLSKYTYTVEEMREIISAID